MTIAEFITLLSYVLLGIGGYWLLVHAIPVLRAIRLRRAQHWTMQACHIRDDLEKQATQMKCLRADLGSPLPDNGIDSTSMLRKKVNRLLTAGPSGGMGQWLDQSRHCDASLKSAISESIQSEATTSTGYRRIASAILQPDWARVYQRFSVLTALAPIVGLAGTVSGSQVFITDYSAVDAASRSAPPLTGIGDALMTTAIGILLTVGAYLIAMVAAHVKRQYEQALAEATDTVLTSYRRWQQERHRLHSQWELRTRRMRSVHR